MDDISIDHDEDAHGATSPADAAAEPLDIVELLGSLDDVADTAGPHPSALDDVEAKP